MSDSNNENLAKFDEKTKVQLLELGLPEKLQADLLNKDDDWSFVIKSHALLEAGATRALLLYFGHSELENVFSQLDMGNKKYGKISILSNLNIIRHEFVDYLYKFGELRNELVHQIKNTTFSFKGQNSPEVQGKLEGLLRATKKVWNTPIEGDSSQGELEIDFVEKLARGMITSALVWCLWEFVHIETLGILKSSKARLGENVMLALKEENG